MSRLHHCYAVTNSSQMEMFLLLSGYSLSQIEDGFPMFSKKANISVPRRFRKMMTYALSHSACISCSRFFLHLKHTLFSCLHVHGTPYMYAL